MIGLMFLAIIPLTENCSKNESGSDLQANFTTYPHYSRFITVGQSVRFQNTTTGGTKPYDLSWTFEKGSPLQATSDVPEITYNTPGSFKVTLTVKDNDGIYSTEQKLNYIVVESTTPELSVAPGFAFDDPDIW